MSETSLQHPNPYIVGRPVEGATLYGREDVFGFVYDTLVASKQNAVVLYGQRRAGKTSILHELPNRLPREKFHFAFFDLQGQAGLGMADVLHNLAVAIAESLKMTPPDKGGFQTKKDYFRKKFLPAVWQKLGERRLLLLFDEFEVPSESEDKVVRDRAEQEFYPYMRELLDKETRLSFVFVIGRRIDDLAHWVKRVFKEAQYKKIGLLKRPEAIDLITKPAEHILNYKPEAIETILDLTSGHPFFTQLLCFELFNYAQKRKSNTILAADVSAIVARALESGQPAFTWLWDAISTSGKIYLAAIACIRSENRKANKDTIQEVLNEFRIRPGPDWNSVSRELADWDVLRDDTSDIQFVVRLVELWVRKSHTLRGIKAALMHEGDGEFRKARALAQQGDFALAVKAFRDLLTTNPNHLGTQLALAQTLLDQKELKEAVEAFEEAFWLDEDVGREGLIDARLAMAQALEEQEQFVEAAVHYRRVLELKPDEYRVQEKLRILYDQGRKAAAAEDWEKAARSLERVTDIDRDYKDAHDRRDYAFRQVKLATQPKDAQAAPEPPSPPPPRSRPLAPIVGLVIALALLGGIGGWLIWGRGPAPETPTPTQAIANLDRTPTTQPTTEATIEATQEPTLAPTEEPTKEPSPEPTVEPTSTSTEEPTPEPPSTPTQEPTPEPTPTVISTPTPIIIVVTPTPTPTPALPSYPQPQLISPPNLDLASGEGHFTGRFSQPRLEWQPVPGLAQNDFYTVSVSFQTATGVTFEGATIKDTFWVVDQRFYDEVAGPQRDFTWWVVVSHFEGSTTDAQGKLEPVGAGVEVSPQSEKRIFRWD
jgi:tetratricopeptide (TPR) repeat protein